MRKFFRQLWCALVRQHQNAIPYFDHEGWLTHLDCIDCGFRVDADNTGTVRWP